MASAHLVLRSVKSLHTLNSIFVYHFSNSFSCKTVKSIRLVNSSFRNYTTVAGRYFSDKHEWVEVSGDSGTVGITQYAQEALGDIVFAQLPDVSREISKDDEVGALESVKAASELYSPVSGKVTEKNLEVENSPALINQSCYEKGWLFRLKLSNAEELKGLMTEDQYKKFLTSEAVN